ncbi:MAG TPA: hypothetical protein VKS82_00275 [Streptosporangiaceae bacterium]|nr:hypothetical protein [Streptosporangiaceae bacterium]
MGSKPVADLWPVLDDAFRSAAGSLDADGTQRVFDGVPGSMPPWMPTRPLFMDLAHYNDLTRVTNRLVRLALQCCQRRAATAGQLLGALGMRRSDVPLLDHSAPLSEDLLISVRPDVVYHDGVPKFLELNIDGGVGGTLQVDIFARRFLGEYARAMGGGGGGIRAAQSSVDTRFAALRTWLAGTPGASGPGGRLSGGIRVVIPVFSIGAVPGLVGNPDRFIAWLGPWCDSGRRHGLDTVAYPLDQLSSAADGRLCAGAGPVDAVIRLFPYADQPDSTGKQALARAVTSGRVRMHTPEATCLLMNKRVLAWLWADLGLLGEADQELITRHVPWTVHLAAGTTDDDAVFRQAVANRSGLVLKPANGYGGTGVLIGHTLTQPDWAAALAAAAADGGHVLQAYTEPDRISLDFVHRATGERCTVDVPFVLGQFIFAGHPSGVLVRHGAPDGGLVLNAHHGAIMNTVLLVDSRS